MKPFIREAKLPDDVAPLTGLLHRAYAGLADMGLHFTACDQPPEVTERRMRAGVCFVAEFEDRIAGTISIRRATPEDVVEPFRDPETMICGQFGVEPDLRGRGIGGALHQHAIDFAVASGARTLALDTAEPAAHLIALYSRWGYRIVARHRWSSTNYRSVIMTRPLAGV
jgi:GNAT superfamily N-acetyltransferase